MSSEQDSEPDVYYAPGAANMYNPDAHAIILDKDLLDHPRAHEHILEHELEHARNAPQSCRELIRHEFRNDAEHHFATTEDIQAVRKYYADCDDDVDPRIVVVNHVRALWTAVMQPAGALYRVLRN